MYKFIDIDFESYSDVIIHDGDSQLYNAFYKMSHVSYKAYKFRDVDFESYSDMIIHDGDSQLYIMLSTK